MSREPFNALQVFIAVARAQNLTHAAEHLHLTVSALSHQIRLLEARVDCALLVRGPRGVKLTAEGQHLLDNVAPHLAAIEEALKPLCGRRDDTLSLSCLPSMASSWLLPRLPRFVARNPSIELSLDSSDELVDFAAGHYDAALRNGLGDWPGVVVEPLLEEWLTPVASPTLLRGRAQPALDRLGSVPLVGPAETWQRWVAQFGGRPPRHYVVSFGDAESRQRAAVGGLGVTLGRTTMVRPLLEAGQLVALYPEMMKSARAHYLVYPERSRKHPGFVVFREWLLGEAARYRAAPRTALPRRSPARARKLRLHRGE
jgi:LysR family glycine cleavage system transcriptional activator